MSVPKRKDAATRVDRALDALDSIFNIARGMTDYYRSQSKQMKKAIKEFERSIDGLFSKDDIPSSIIEAATAPDSENVDPKS